LQRGINQRAGIQTAPGVVVSLEPNAVEWARRTELNAQAERIKADAASQGKILTNTEILEKLDAGIVSARNATGAQQARDRLKAIEAKLGDGPITFQNLPTLRRKYEGNPGKTRELDAAERYLRQVNGGQ